MPKVAGWIDDLRLAFGSQDVTSWMREGISTGTFHACENGHEIGQPIAGMDNAVSADKIVLEAGQAPKGARR